MFISLKLTNFSQHRNREFHFGPGLVGIRGANEKGKTKVLQAMAYLLHGSRALSKSVARVVTWGEPENTLRVEGVIEVAGVLYSAYRSPKGAEITYTDAEGPQRITGQTETASFFTKILGCNRDMAGQLMFVKQKKIAETLEESGKAVALIEKLSEVAIIDKMIEAIRFEMSTGNTKSLEQTLAEAQAALVACEVPVLADEPLAEAVNALTAAVTAASAALAAGRKEAAAAMELSVRYSTAAAQLAAATRAVGVQSRQLAETDEQLHKVDVKPQFTAEQQAEAEKAKEEARSAVDSQAKFARWKALPKAVAEYTAIGDDAEAELIAELADTQAKRVAKNTQVLALNNQVALLNNAIWENGALRIRETACGLCGKDLQNVPEVVEKNARVDAVDAELQVKMLDLKAQQQQAAADLAEIDQLETALTNCQKWAEKHVMATLRELERDGFLTLDRRCYPPVGSWTGRTTDASAFQAASARLAEILSDVQRVAVQQGLLDSLTAAVARDTRQLERLLAEESACKEAVAQFHPGVVEEHLNKAARVEELQQALDNRNRELDEAKLALRDEQQRFQLAVNHRRGLENMVDTKRALLTDYNENNDIIKRLLEIKPLIADKLWTAVLSSVSRYFSDIRQVESVVTRENNDFAVNGVLVDDFSGSAVDSLGLAVRAALTRTFLPNVDFILLDEPAAACDADREAAMLGVLSTLGFKQIVVISHSDVLDSFANSVIEI